MLYRKFGRLNWSVSEIGVGMWGMAGWSGSSDDESMASLQLALDLGVNFFDTAWGYGSGHSERLLGRLIADNPGRAITTATKIPPKNFTGPSERGFTLDDCFPPDHIREYAEKSVSNIGRLPIDLLQFHVWEDAWATDDRWIRTMEELKRDGLIKAVGVSINRWEPSNVLNTLKTGQVDAVQVIYNIFDQSPQDELFPLCAELEIAVIARVPFDEGTLTGTLTKETRWPEGDWRNGYFCTENLIASVDHAESLRPLVPSGMTMAELALRWILEDSRVSTIIPGMRKHTNVRANVATSDGVRLDPALMQALKAHRWDRTPTEWSR